MMKRPRYGYLGTYDPRPVSQGGDVVYQSPGAPLFDAAGREGIERAKRELYPLLAFAALLALSAGKQRRRR